MKISIIIPVYNSEDTLDLCLEAVFKSDIKDYEVVVIDDASHDSSVKISQKYPCRLIALKENRGAASARNIGAKSAGGSILVFIDSDIVVYPSAIGELVRHLDEAGIAGAVGMYSAKNRFGNFLSQYKHMVVCFRDLMTEDVNKDSFKAAFLALKKEVFSCLSFDENIKRASIEDIEFGRELISKGFRFVLDKDIRVEHIKRFGMKSYFKNQYHRSYDIGMNYMVRGSHKFYLTKERGNFYAKAYILRVPLSAAFALFTLMAAAFKSLLILIGSAMVLVFSIILEHKFLYYSRKER
ncbi:MAG: glycosyltransferase family 2 protein, partial [Candidatus Omnitrophota bacterium]